MPFEVLHTVDRPRAIGVEQTVCASCRGSERALYRPRMYRIGEQRFDLVRCACGLVYVDPRPHDQVLDRLYDDPEYFVDGYNLGVETDAYFARADELLRLYDGEVRRLELETGGCGRLLELGSAGGFFLEAARRRGWEVHGVERSPMAARWSREHLALDVFEGVLEQAPFAADSFDVIVADNVLEHMPSPDRVLNDLRDLCRRDGHLLVIVPAYVNSFWFRALRSLQTILPRRFLGPRLMRILKLDSSTDYGPPYHLQEFEPQALVTLLQRSGWEVVAVEGSIPFPAEVFKTSATLRTTLLGGIFRVLDAGIRLRLLPAARLRVLARRR